MYKIILRSSDSNSFKTAVSKVLCQLPSKSSFVRLPEKRKIFSVLRSPHVNSKAKDRFYLVYHKAIITLNTALSQELISCLSLLSRDVSITLKKS